MVNELTARCIGIGCAPLHSIKITLRKTWHTYMCERARDQSRSIFLSNDAYAFDVCTFLLLPLLHRLYCCIVCPQRTS